MRSEYALHINQVAARRIATELTSACRRLDSSDWLTILLSSAKTASSETAVAKVNQVRRICTSLRDAGSRYLRDGIRKSAQEDAKRVGQYAVALPRRVNSTVQRFRSLARGQQANEVANLLLTWIIFWASAGGADLEGGLPDTDLAFGIDDHRNLFSHSILLGLGTEAGLRFAADLFDRVCDRLPFDHSKAWDSSRAFLRANKHRAIFAVWAGIGAHFLKDAAILDAATKPYVGIPGSMPMDAHQALYAANSATSFLMATVPDTTSNR